MKNASPLLAAAVAALVAGAPLAGCSSSSDRDSTMSSMAEAKHACAGKNACKGQGHTKTTKADCEAKGGKVVEPKK